MKNKKNTKNKNRKGLVICIILFGLIVLGLSGWIIYRNKANKITNSRLKEYENDLTFVFEDNNYEVYKLKCSKISEEENSLYYNCYENTPEIYYLLNNKNDKLYYPINMYSSSENEYDSKDYYLILEYEEESSDEIFGLLDIKHKKILNGYEDYSCGYHSDVSSVLCKGNKTTLLKDDNDKFGIYSFDDSKIILPVEYNTIYNVDLNKYLVEKDDKYGIINEKMEYLFKLEYDFIGFNEDIGYILIKDNDVKLYDKNLKEKNVNELTQLYDNALKNNEGNYIQLDNSNSYYWFSGSYFVKANISKKFNFNNDSESYFKYTGSKLSGEKLIIYDQYGACNKNAKLYVIDGNKVVIVNSNEIVATTECW